MIGNNEMKIGGIVLAAGSSSRLGKPKQLVQFEGRSLLRHSAEAMAASMCDPIVVVLGAEAEPSAAEIQELRVTAFFNEDWRSGMSSSIIAGLAKLIETEPELVGVIITLCDQPFITSEILDRFVERFMDTKAAVVAASYDGVNGVPALFSRKMFGELAQLKGDKGARDLIRGRQGVEMVDLPQAAFDIDTTEDAAKLGT